MRQGIVYFKERLKISGVFTLFLLALFLPSPSGAATTVLEQATESVSLNGRMEVLRDPSGKLTIEDMARPEVAGSFKPTSKRFSAGYTKDVVWLRFTLQRADTNVDKEWWLEIYPPFLDYLTLYVPDGPDMSAVRRSFTEKHAGRLLPVSVREIVERNYVFVVKLMDTGSHTYYMRVRTTGAMFVDARVWDTHAFARASGGISLLLGGFYGVLGLIALLNLIFWLVLKDRLFIIYSLFLVSLAGAFMQSNGYIALYLFPEQPYLIYLMNGTSISMVLITGSLLIEELIPLDKRSFWRRSFIAIRAFAVFGIIMTLAGQFRFVGEPLHLTGLYLALSCVIVSAIGIYRRLPLAKLYAVTFFIYYMGGIMTVIRNTDLFGLARPFMDNAFQIGTFSHMVLIQVAIALRFNSQETEREIAARAREWEETFNSISDMVIILDREHMILKANKAASSLLNEGAGVIVGLKCHALHHLSGEQRLDCPCRETFFTKKASTVEFFEPLFQKHLEISTSPIFNTAGEVTAVVHITKDITWRKNMEEEVVRSQKLESMALLGGGIAHDFNNMLTVIMSTVTLAKMYAGENENVIEKLDEAGHEIMHARELTGQLLTFAKGGAPIKKLSSLPDLLQDTVNFSTKGSAVKCEFMISDDLWSAEIDKIQISQVISNLAINAIQSMHLGGTMTVRARNEVIDKPGGMSMDGRYVIISIEDHGSGIPPADLDRIFDPFFTTKPKGSGLGLATCYSIIRKHGGHIDVRSRPGEGSIFSVYLPALLKAVVEELPREGGDLIGGGRVLIMDDDEALLKNVSELLANIGYEVETARNGEEAVILYKRARVLSRPFDSVVLDLTVVDGMGGRACLQEIMDIDLLARAIVMSGYSEDAVLSEFRQHGFSAAVVKPFTIEELHSALQKVMSEKGEIDA